MDIVKRNLFRLLRSGALNEYEPLEPMTRYKWRRLFALSEAMRLDDLAEAGARHSRFAPDGIPADVLDAFCSRPQTDAQTQGTGTSAAEARLYNWWLQRRLTAIRENEPHAIDASMATVELLDLLVAATRAMLGHGLCLRETLLVGRYLRTRGQLVDFVKLDKWLHKLHIWRMASLTGCILISAFGFDADEIPFVHADGRKASAVATDLMQSGSLSSSAAEWHFRQNRSGLVMGNTRASFKSLRRSMRFFGYAHLETVATLAHDFVTSLSEIEE